MYSEVPCLERARSVQALYSEVQCTMGNGVFTLAVSGSGTGTGTRTYITQKPFILAVSGARTKHLKTIEISLKHTI